MKSVLTAPRYRGEDESRQPYTLTAVTARQNGPERVDLVGPVGDVTLNGNSWIHVTATAGTFLQKANQLDLAGEVILYRDDGSILNTESVTRDIREGDPIRRTALPRKQLIAN